jgi:hypothetical protein
MLNALAMVLMIWSCGCLARPEPPERPSTVPSSAVWVGGPKGGVWIECRVDRVEDVNPCTVHNEFTGKVEMSGDFELQSERRAATSEELQFSGCDFRAIDLKNGLMLVLVDAPTPGEWPPARIDEE